MSTKSYPHSSHSSSPLGEDIAEAMLTRLKTPFHRSLFNDSDVDKPTRR